MKRNENMAIFSTLFVFQILLLADITLSEKLLYLGCRIEKGTDLTKVMETDVDHLDMLFNPSSDEEPIEITVAQENGVKGTLQVNGTKDRWLDLRLHLKGEFSATTGIFRGNGIKVLPKDNKTISVIDDILKNITVRNVKEGALNCPQGLPYKKLFPNRQTSASFPVLEDQADESYVFLPLNKTTITFQTKENENSRYAVLSWNETLTVKNNYLDTNGIPSLQPQRLTFHYTTRNVAVLDKDGTKLGDVRRDGNERITFRHNDLSAVVYIVQCLRSDCTSFTGDFRSGDHNTHDVVTGETTSDSITTHKNAQVEITSTQTDTNEYETGSPITSCQKIASLTGLGSENILFLAATLVLAVVLVVTVIWFRYQLSIARKPANPNSSTTRGNANADVSAIYTNNVTSVQTENDIYDSLDNNMVSVQTENDIYDSVGNMR